MHRAAARPSRRHPKRSCTTQNPPGCDRGPGLRCRAARRRARAHSSAIPGCRRPSGQGSPVRGRRRRRRRPPGTAVRVRFVPRLTAGTAAKTRSESVLQSVSQATRDAAATASVHAAKFRQSACRKRCRAWFTPAPARWPLASSTLRRSRPSRYPRRTWSCAAAAGGLVETAGRFCRAGPHLAPAASLLDVDGPGCGRTSHPGDGGSAPCGSNSIHLDKYQ